MFHTVSIGGIQKYVRRGRGEGVLKKRTKTNRGRGWSRLSVRSLCEKLTKANVRRGREKGGGGGTCKMNRNEQGGGGGQKLETSSERTF